MEPFNQLDLAMREWARRFLRHSEIFTQSPTIISDKILSLHLYFNDNAPSQFSEIIQSINVLESILLYSNDILIGQVGGEIIDDLTSVYIPTDNIFDKWDELDKIIRELIHAGYPGCVGCGGPGSEEAWDENKNREYIMKHSTE